MTNNQGDQSGQNPCCDGAVVTMDKVIKIINAKERYNDDEARTCFWLYVEGLNGDPGKKTEFTEVLNVMKKQRPTAHETILVKASAILHH